MLLSKLFFISILSFLISATAFTHSYSQCLEDQRGLLLQLKKELIFSSSLSTKLVQWNQTHDCCTWYGVDCDVAGYVVSLQLDQEFISGGIGESSSLFRFKYLEKLNLANNDFNSTPIPKGIHNLTYLTHLKLSNAGFGGQVPLQLSSLTRLVSLDISNYAYWLTGPLKLEYPNLEMLIQNLTGLRELFLDGVNIISPYGNNHSTTKFLDFFANLSSLTTLSLAGCSLKGSFPTMIFQIPTLQYLDLSLNKLLSGSIPPFPQNGSLKSVRLTMTNFSGSIPSSISNLKNLSEIYLSGCKFTGSIPSTFANLTQLIRVYLSSNFLTGSLSSELFEGLSSLVSLNLEYNSFSGKFPHFLFGLPSLEELRLGGNHFTGKVEAFSIVNVSNIVALDLSSNRLEGPIPDSLFQLQSLEILILSENLFSGTFQLPKIQSLANLRVLDLSRNNLRVDVTNHNSTSYGFPQLQSLHLASCNLHVIPDFIKHSDISILDLSNNGIGGAIPSWIWGLTQLDNLNLSHNLLTDVQKPFHIPPSLTLLFLHSNQLSGELQQLITPNIRFDRKLLFLLSLSNNSLSGSIPTSLCDFTQLYILDLSDNKLSGTIPSCLLATSLLYAIDLGRNNISGPIPDTFPPNCQLISVDLNSNTLEGKIPKSLESCKSLKWMNVGNNIIYDTFPCMLSSNLSVLVLHSNKFHGEVRCDNSWPNLQILDISSNNFNGSLESINFSSWRAMVQGSDSQLRRNLLDLISVYSVDGFRFTMKGVEVDLVKIFQDFTAIDLSCNNFRGEIPNAIGDLSSLRLLNLSHNALNESIPKSLGKLRMLEALDISRNQLTGAIPMELAGLTFLSVLNLSYNMLVGEIPNGRQLQTFPPESFIGNPWLCGFNLNISCTPTDSPELEKVEEKKREIEWEYVSAALGYVVGLGSIVWLLLFCRSFRKKYFDKIDEVVEQILDARDMRRRRRVTARRRAVRNRVRRQ